ncbi:MAG: hypothetical protein AAF729_04465, partial [Pseudomonadota bacterium]
MITPLTFQEEFAHSMAHQMGGTRQYWLRRHSVGLTAIRCGKTQEEVKMKKTVIFGALTVAGLAAG